MDDAHKTADTPETAGDRCYVKNTSPELRAEGSSRQDKQQEQYKGQSRRNWGVNW